ACGQINPKTAHTLAYLAQIMAQTLPMAADEFARTFGDEPLLATVTSAFGKLNPNSSKPSKILTPTPMTQTTPTIPKTPANPTRPLPPPTRSIPRHPTPPLSTRSTLPIHNPLTLFRITRFISDTKQRT